MLSNIFISALVTALLQLVSYQYNRDFKWTVFVFHFTLVWYIVTALSNKNFGKLINWIKEKYKEGNTKSLLRMVKEGVILKNGVVIGIVFAFYLFVGMFYPLSLLFEAVLALYALTVGFYEINGIEIGQETHDVFYRLGQYDFDRVITTDFITTLILIGVVILIGIGQKIAQKNGYGDSGHY